jgi:hypothetical protein
MATNSITPPVPVHSVPDQALPGSGAQYAGPDLSIHNPGGNVAVVLVVEDVEAVELVVEDVEAVELVVE